VQPDSSTSTPAPQALMAAVPQIPARTVRILLLLAAVFVSAWLSLGVVDTDSLVPAIWPAGALATGLVLTSPRRLRPPSSPPRSGWF
jgi:hypothetical protein